jgi:hypothetical protein
MCVQFAVGFCDWVGAIVLEGFGVKVGQNDPVCLATPLKVRT